MTNLSLTPDFERPRPRPRRKKEVWAVATPIHNSPRGVVVSLHRTAAGAEKAIRAATKALRRQSGYEEAWLDRVVVRVPAGMTAGKNIAIHRG